MSNAHNNNATENEYIPETYIPHSENHGTKEIWQKFWILLVITIMDFIVYFIKVSPDFKIYKNIFFIIFGIIKAYFIVGTFMHLKNEKTNLIMTVLVPIVFILWFITWMMYEGHALSTY
ncbi:MAG: cytochrome C oxidase subunit IV family protein [Bacteroidia bacterium]|nr:cytochrome C oxidase subunit IV family protein [Bacteroidia bacterium]